MAKATTVGLNPTGTRGKMRFMTVSPRKNKTINRETDEIRKRGREKRERERREALASGCCYAVLSLAALFVVVREIDR